jgi:uncharacterized protein
MSAVGLSLWAGFIIGAVFGITGQRTGFCLTSGLRNFLLEGDGRKLRAFALALAVGILGAQTLAVAGLVELERSIYTGPNFSWLVLPAGGLLFGFGMVAANGCGARALVLLGQGNLRSFVVLTCLGISAFVALTGLLAPLRTLLSNATLTAIGQVPQTLPHLLIAAGLAPAAARVLIALALATPLLAFAFASARFRASPRNIAGGLLIGALIPAGWFATGYLGADDFDPVPVASLTFVAPIGETIQYAMLSTGTALGFGVAVVFGVMLGALAASIASRTFSLEGFTSPGRMLRSMAGGIMMGIGGALALGCSIGQGLTGLSTLAIGSFLAAGGILVGAVLALRGPLKLPPL